MLHCIPRTKLELSDSYKVVTFSFVWPLLPLVTEKWVFRIIVTTRWIRQAISKAEKWQTRAYQLKRPCWGNRSTKLKQKLSEQLFGK